MKILKKIIDFLKNKNVFKYMSDRKYLKFLYWLSFDKKIDIDSPKTFNEKLQWLKLYDRNPKYTNMVDKYEVKKYVSKIIGEEYIIPTIGIYDKFDDIDFDKIPSKFVIKCTHDSGGLIIVTDKASVDLNSIKRKINKSLKRNYYYYGREWPYKNVKPRIIIEKYCNDSITNELRDYKFFCFNGVVKCFKIDFDRFKSHRANYYDRKGNLLRFGEEICPPQYEKEIKIPLNLEKMIILAEKLSNGIPFLRVDLYEENGKILFGELTFYPASGLGKFIPNEWDKKLGEWLDI